jgi:7-carboxy-7-deazaguanine synthase
MEALPINELFLTIQGEATFTGTPSVFVRLQGCPVGCAWCDTKHTWSYREAARVSVEDVLAKGGDNPTPTWAAMTTNELVATLERLGAPEHVVLTGGEPCLHDLVPLTERLVARGSVQVETSGTHQVRVHPQTWVTVSPKVGMAGGLAVRGDALARANEIKHPVENHADLAALDQLLAGLEQRPTVWLQPVSQGELATQLCIDECLRRGWRLSLQTHKYAGLR